MGCEERLDSQECRERRLSAERAAGERAHGIGKAADLAPGPALGHSPGNTSDECIAGSGRIHRVDRERWHVPTLALGDHAATLRPARNQGGTQVFSAHAVLQGRHRVSRTPSAGDLKEFPLTPDDCIVAQREIERIGEAAIRQIGERAENPGRRYGMCGQIKQEPSQRNVSHVQDKEVTAEERGDIKPVVADDLRSFFPEDGSFEGIRADDHRCQVSHLSVFDSQPSAIDIFRREAMANHGSALVVSDRRGNADGCAKPGKGYRRVCGGASRRGNFFEHVRASTRFRITGNREEPVPGDETDTINAGLPFARRHGCTLNPQSGLKSRIDAFIRIMPLSAPCMSHCGEEIVATADAAINREHHDSVRARARSLALALHSYEPLVEAAADAVPATLEREIVAICLASGLFAPNMPAALGGSGLTLTEQVIVEEELGGVTNWLWAALWRPPNVLVHASPAQRERYVLPYTRGEARGCYAITEPGAGSDVSHLQTVARADGDGWRISGEKWFVTGGDVASFVLVVASTETARGSVPTIFFVDRNALGVQWGQSPTFTNHALYGHPELALDAVRVGPDDALGDIGAGITLTHDWFREERLMIAARCVGAARRCLELAHDWSRTRQAFGHPIGDYQGVQWMLADSATELAAARALLYQTVDAFEAGLDVKIAHGQAAMVKLYASEMVNRVADRAVQIFGGRGYMRENPVERLWRDTRIDRIWEGTSEMQRLIVARALDRRGLDSLLAH